MRFKGIEKKSKHNEYKYLIRQRSGGIEARHFIWSPGKKKKEKKKYVKSSFYRITEHTRWFKSSSIVFFKKVDTRFFLFLLFQVNIPSNMFSMLMPDLLSLPLTCQNDEVHIAWLFRDLFGNNLPFILLALTEVCGSAKEMLCSTAIMVFQLFSQFQFSLQIALLIQLTLLRLRDLLFYYTFMQDIFFL